MFHYTKLKNRSTKEMSIPNFFWGKTSIKQKPENKQAKKKRQNKKKKTCSIKMKSKCKLIFFQYNYHQHHHHYYYYIIAIIIIISCELIGYHILKEGTLFFKNTNLEAVKVSI